MEANACYARLLSRVGQEVCKGPVSGTKICFSFMSQLIERVLVEDLTQDTAYPDATPARACHTMQEMSHAFADTLRQNMVTKLTGSL